MALKLLETRGISPNPSGQPGAEGSQVVKCLTNCAYPCDLRRAYNLLEPLTKSYEIRGFESPTMCGIPFARSEVGGKKPYAKSRAASHSDGGAPPVSAG